MTNIATITFYPNGKARCFYTDEINLHCLGSLQITRVTTIEWNHRDCLWEVKDNQGTLLFSNPSRQLCQAWEHKHFNQ